MRDNPNMAVVLFSLFCDYCTPPDNEDLVLRLGLLFDQRKDILPVYLFAEYDMQNANRCLSEANIIDRIFFINHDYGRKNRPLAINILKSYVVLISWGSFF